MTDSSLSKEIFSNRVQQLLDGKDAVTIEAGNLTDFSWKSLCFERERTLLLKFDADAGKTTLSLPYEEFFVDEGHVPGSLEDTCVAPTDHIYLKKKYPGYTGPVEFQKVTSPKD